MRVAVREWALQHEPLPSDATIQRLLRFGDRMFETRIEGLAIGDDDAVVTPFHHLQLLFDAANRYGDALESRALKDVIEDECRLRYSPRVTRLVMKLADALPVELLRAALEHEPVESAQLALGDPDRRELIRHGLITPVSASEQDGALYYLDPLLATAGLARR